MKLSTKLKISFAVLIFVPVILFSLAFLCLSSYKLYQLKHIYEANNASLETLANPLDLVTSICKKQYEQLKDAVDNDPQKLLDDSFQEKLDKNLSKKSAFLIVTYNGETIFAGDSSSRDILVKLKESNFNPKGDNGIYIGGDHKVVCYALPYTYNDREGFAYIVMDVAQIAPQMRRLIIDAIIAVVLVLIITSGIFVTWIHRSTLSPIKKLKLATQNIKDGNLDFEISVKGKDEIAELCRDFDSMRIRLMENEEEKIENDAQSKILISNISHDLKTPITTIKGYVEGIIDGVVDTPEKMDRYLKTIYNKACDMDKLIDELTFYSKIDTNNIPYQFAQIDVAGYFSDCIDDLGSELESEGFTVTYNNRLSGSIKIMADSEQLKRAINNVINNSVKYMDKVDKRISFTVSEEANMVRIDIEDNGKGIPQDAVKHVFDRFYRADMSRNQKRPGNGIGLSIVKKIIDDHDGTVSAKSTFGQGTIITIKLPVFTHN